MRSCIDSDFYRVLMKMHIRNSIFKWLDLDKNYQISKSADSHDVHVSEVKQPVHYSRLYDYYINKPEQFANHVKEPCSLSFSKQDLVKLFDHSIINGQLLRVFEFQGLSRHCSWSSLHTFYKLLELVPKELEHILNRLLEFWEGVYLLANSNDSVHKDTQTASCIGGLWPLMCEDDKDKIQEFIRQRKLFPSIKDPNERANIEKKILELEYRVPNFSVVVSESGAFLQIARLLSSILKKKGMGYSLEESKIFWQGKLANKFQYFYCFLEATRANKANKTNTDDKNLRHIFELSKDFHPSLTGSLDATTLETSKLRRVSSYPYGIWNDFSDSITRIFDHRVFWNLHVKHDEKPKELPLCLLTRDFFGSFFSNLFVLRCAKNSSIMICNVITQYGPFRLSILKDHESTKQSVGLEGLNCSSSVYTLVSNPVEGDTRRAVNIERGQRIKSFSGTIVSENAVDLSTQLSNKIYEVASQEIADIDISTHNTPFFPSNTEPTLQSWQKSSTQFLYDAGNPFSNIIHPSLPKKALMSRKSSSIDSQESWRSSDRTACSSRYSYTDYLITQNKEQSTKRLSSVDRGETWSHEATLLQSNDQTIPCSTASNNNIESSQERLNVRCVRIYGEVKLTRFV